MTLTLSDHLALNLAAQIASQHFERAHALAQAAQAQRAINNNPQAAGQHSSTIFYPLTDAELLAEAIVKLEKLARERVVEF